MKGVAQKPAILVIDDDAATRRLHCRLLRELGYERVTLCEGGAEAILQLRTEPSSAIHVIFLDVDMPRMDGVEVIRRLAAEGYDGQLVLSSGHGDKLLESISRLIVTHGLRFAGTLHKPVRREHLSILMARIAGSVPTRPPDAAPGDGYTPEDLQWALAGGELVTYFQPQVSLESGAAVGAEALVRWRHPRDGLVPPLRFIPLAAACGLMPAVTRFVLSSAMAEAANWQRQGLDLQMAVNVSMLDVADIGFADAMAAMAREAEVDPGGITLEVTEDQVMSRPSAVLDVLARLSLRRFRLSIDDFGTGHSSLAQLRDLPFDELKIDQSFVHGAGRDDRLRAICTASIHMAHQLKMKVVAEGIEEQADWDLLRLLDCDVGQGYLIGRPQSAEATHEWFARRATTAPRWHRDG